MFSQVQLLDFIYAYKITYGYMPRMQTGSLGEQRELMEGQTGKGTQQRMEGDMSSVQHTCVPGGKTEHNTTVFPCQGLHLGPSLCQAVSATMLSLVQLCILLLIPVLPWNTVWRPKWLRQETGKMALEWCEHIMYPFNLFASQGPRVSATVNVHTSIPWGLLGELVHRIFVSICSEGKKTGEFSK